MRKVAAEFHSPRCVHQSVKIVDGYGVGDDFTEPGVRDEKIRCPPLAAIFLVWIKFVDWQIHYYHATDSLIAFPSRKIYHNPSGESTQYQERNKLSSSIIGGRWLKAGRRVHIAHGSEL